MNSLDATEYQKKIKELDDDESLDDEIDLLAEEFTYLSQAKIHLSYTDFMKMPYSRRYYLVSKAIKIIEKKAQSMDDAMDDM